MQSATPFNDPALFIQRIKRAKEIIAPAQMKIHLDKAMAQYKKDEGLIGMINLLMEVDSAEPDVRKIGRYIDEISSLQEIEIQSELKDGEEEPEGRKRKNL